MPREPAARWVVEMRSSEELRPVPAAFAVAEPAIKRLPLGVVGAFQLHHAYLLWHAHLMP